MVELTATTAAATLPRPTNTDAPTDTDGAGRTTRSTGAPAKIADENADAASFFSPTSDESMDATVEASSSARAPREDAHSAMWRKKSRRKSIVGTSTKGMME